MNTYADVAELVEKLNLRDAIHLGHSTGGGEVARYVAKYGKGRVAKAVLISAVPPIMVESDKDPGGTPIEVFDKIREGTAKNRARFYRDITLPFYGYNWPGATISQGIRDNWWRQGMMGGIKAHYDCMRLPVICLVVVSALLCPPSRAQVPVFHVTPIQSSIRFNMTSSRPLTGNFDKWNATLTFASPDPTSAVLQVEIQTASVHSEDARQTKQLPMCGREIPGIVSPGGENPVTAR